MPEGNAIRSYYDDYSDWYEGERREGYYGVINELEFDKIRESVTGRETLEIGCGTGLILERTAAVAKRARGIDLSHGMLGVSRRKGLEVTQASAVTLPFPDGSFDVVYSFKVLPHVPDIRSAVSEVHRVLRRGGSAFLEFYNPFSLKFFANRLSEIFRRRRDVYLRFDTRADVRRYSAGLFDIASVRGVRIFAPSRHFYTTPVIGPLFRWLERRFCDTKAAAAGGYMVFELKRLDG